MAKKHSGNSNRYIRLLEEIFLLNYREGESYFEFSRTLIEDIAVRLQIKLPKNLGDVLYSFRFRQQMPELILEKTKPDYEWSIQLAGRAKYRMIHRRVLKLEPDHCMETISIPDATPEIVTRNALSDEQALLAKVRYNRLVDIFLKVTAYSLQNHLRTSVPNIGQIETDEVYVAVTNTGDQFVIPVQAKVARDRIGLVQIEQDFALCKYKYPNLRARPVAVQTVKNEGIEIIVMYELVEKGDEIRIKDKKHYRLVRSEKLHIRHN